MDEVTIHLQHDHPIDVHCDGDTRPCSSFLLLANVPADPPGIVMLTYGSSSSVANAIMTFWQRSCHEDPKMAWTLEQVARGIVGFADAERAKWPDDSRAGKA